MRITVTNLNPNTPYLVRARSKIGSSYSDWSRNFSFSTLGDLVAPQKPANVVGSMSGTSFKLAWDAVTLSVDNSPANDLHHYEVLVSSAGTSTTSVYKTTDTKFELSLEMNTSLFGSPRANISMAVRSVDAMGNTDGYSTTISQTNPAPSNVTALTGASGNFVLTFAWIASPDLDLKQYNVYSGTTSTSQTTLVWSGPATGATIQSTDTTTDKWYRVTAVDVFGSESTGVVVGPLKPRDPVAVDTLAPGVPAGLTASLVNAVDGKTASASLSWTALTDNDLDSYIVAYRQVATPVNDWQYTIIDRSTTTTTIQGLVPYKNYDFRLRAKDYSANYSAWSTIVTATAAANTAPAVPAGLAVTAGRDNLQISWTENSENDMANNAGTYDVTVATNSGFTTGVLQYRTGATTLSINGLASSTAYWVRVRATDTAGLSSAYSASVSATTGTFPSTALSDGNAPASSPVPNGVPGIGYILASWTPIANNDLVTYEVHLGTSSTFTASASTKVTEVAGSSIVLRTDATGTPLSQSTNYYLRTIAKDRDGSAAASAASAAVQMAKVAVGDLNVTPRQIGVPIVTTAATAPTSPIAGDIWNDTVAGVEKVWDTSGTPQWVATGNVSGGYVAGNSSKVYIQSSAPAGRTQDLWIDTTGGANTPKRWTGTAWVVATDKVATDAAAAAQSAIDNLANNYTNTTGMNSAIQAAANGKNKITYSTLDASGTGFVEGDTWRKVTTLGAGGKIIKEWTFTSGAWQTKVYSGLTLTDLDAGSITAGFLDVANRVQAGSLTIGQVNGLQAAINLAPSKVNNPTRTGTTDNWTPTTGGTLSIEDKDFFGTTIKAMKSTSTGTTQNYSDYFDVDTTKAYEIKLWVQDPTDSITAGTQFYLGLNVVNTAMSNQNVLAITTATGAVGAANSNPYFYSTSGETAVGDWREHVAYVFPYGALPEEMAGLGKNVTSNYQFTQNVSKMRVRFLNWQNTALNPRDLWVSNISVTEMSIADIRSAALVERWRRTGTTNIDGGLIETNTIKAKSIAIADFMNYLDGSNWEDPTINPWTLASGAVIDTAQFKYGSKSLKIPGTTGATKATYPQFPVVAGEQYNISFWAYRDAAWNGTNGGSRLRIVNQSQGGTVFGVGYGSTDLPSGVWTKLSAVYTIPSTTTALNVTLVSDATAGNVWIDNIDMRRMNSGELILDGTLAANKVTAGTYTGGAFIVGPGGYIQTNTGGVTITDSGITIPDGYFDAKVIRAGSIGAQQLAIGDTSNMAQVNERNIIPLYGGYTHVIETDAGGAKWSNRTLITGAIFPFGVFTGPIPFKTGERVRITFDAYCDAGQSVAARMGLFMAQGTLGSQSIYPISPTTGLPTAGSQTITSTPTSFSFEGNVTVNTSTNTEYLFELMDVANINVRLANVRAYRMGAGELLVDGTVKANKITAGTYTGGEFVVAPGGIIRTNTGGVSITDSGIIIPSGMLDANVLKANTSFITTLNIGAGGAIQSTGYTAGTTGFKMTTSGLVIEGAGNTASASVLKGGTITGTTINVGAGGVLNVDATASIKSNNYAAGNTGYSLGSTGLEVNDGTIDAKVLRTGSAIIGDLTIGRSADALGTIKSFDYAAGVAGWKIGKGQFEINSGTISAAALLLQDGQNIMPPQYADFEFAPAFYAAWGRTGTITSPSISSTRSRYNTSSLSATNGTTAASALYFGSTTTNYNVDVDPTQTYIASFWIYHTNATAQTFRVRFQWDNAAVVDTTISGIAPNVWTRISGIGTPPVGTAKALIGTVAPASTTFYIDGVQVERKIGAINTPSPWTPPSVTSIDGAYIRTGEIRSNANITVNGVARPSWSINMSGGAQFGDAVVRGTMIVGTATTTDDAAASFIASGNYLGGVSGWKIDSMGSAEFNSGIFRGSIDVGGTVSSTVSIIAGDLTTNYAKVSAQGFQIYGRNTDPETAATSPMMPTVSLGAAGGNDLFYLSNAANEISTTISPDGDIAAKTGTFNGDGTTSDLGDPYGLSVGGVELADRIAELPQGIIAQVLKTNSTINKIRSEYGIYEISFMAYPGRHYRVAFWGGRLAVTDPAMGVTIRVRRTTDGSAPTITSAVGREWDTMLSGISGGANLPYVQLNGLYVPVGGTPTLQRILLTLAAWSPPASTDYMNLITSTIYPLEAIVEDLGIDVPDTWIANGGGGVLYTGGTDAGSTTPPPPPVVTKKTYTSQWIANASQTRRGLSSYGDYTINPTTYTGSTKMLAGQYSGTNGNQCSYIQFTGANSTGGEVNKTISSALSGASVSKVELYVKNVSFYGSTGGSQRFAMTAFTGVPGSTTQAPPSLTYTANTGFSTGQGRWITLPSAAASTVLAGGRCAIIGPGSSTGAGYYSTWNNEASAYRPALRITYTK